MSIFDGKLTLIAAAASGTEAIVKRELIKLGYEPEGADYGRIPFAGDFRDVIRANMFLRTANRIKILIVSFQTETFDELFDGVSSYAWEEVLPKDAKINVDAKSIKSKLSALSSIQSVTKKAILTRLERAYKTTRFPETGAEYTFETAIYNDTAVISLDTSGDSLHKRGYRSYLGDAPIRETLAASIIELSVWKPDRPLIDPFCGSGTIPVEAALIGVNAAPGMNRKFACQNFPNAPDVTGSVLDEAEQLINRNAKLRISGFDINPEAVKLALKHASRAGVSEFVHIQQMDMRKLSSRFSHGVIIANPPYGERLMTQKEIKALYADFGKVFETLDEWCAYVITSFRGFEKYFGKRADRTRTQFNSELKCILYQYLGRKPEYASFDTKDI